jgi:hypothetical protein
LFAILPEFHILSYEYFILFAVSQFPTDSF